jgi:hypothetical protein
LPTVQISQAPQPAVAPPPEETGVMGTLRSATAMVQALPQRAARSVAGWFSADPPPRPPATVPTQNFRAEM